MDQKELSVIECVVIGAGISGIAVNNRTFILFDYSYFS